MRSGPLPIPLPLQDGQVRGVHRPGSPLRERRVRGGAEARAPHAHPPLADRVRPLERVPSRSTIERGTSMPTSSWADLPVRLEISNMLPKRVRVCDVGGCGTAVWVEMWVGRALFFICSPVVRSPLEAHTAPCTARTSYGGPPTLGFSGARSGELEVPYDLQLV